MAKKHGKIEEADVLGALGEARDPLSLRELAGKLGAHGRERHELKKLIERLEHSGRVAEVKGGRYLPAERKEAQAAKRKSAPVAAAAGRDLVTGRLVAHRDGYGFVIPDKAVPGMEGDVFIPPSALGDAMHGDRVRVRLVEGRRGRRGGGRVEGRIVSVERRAHATVVGQFHCGEKHNYVDPYEQRILQHILIPRGAEKTAGGPSTARELDGAIVNVEVTRFPGSGAGLPQGKVVEVLGRPGDFGLDVEIIIRKYHLPDEFPEEVLAESRRVPQEADPAEAARRRDFRRLPIVTIDGEDAKDFDDAVYVERLASGNYLLQVHIADVAHYLRPGSELDREARLRGTSVYFPDRAVPMLPEALSNGICSLKPQVDRLVQSCVMEINPQGDVVGYEFADGVIRSAARMTYTAVNAALEGDPATRERHAALVSEFEKMRELALILNAKRERRGSIDFDLPEPLIRFDERGQMIGIARSERNIAHRLIEEFMLAANETVAGHLGRLGVGSLYRIHEEPDPQKVLEFEEIASTFGYSLGIAEQVIRKVRVHERQRPGRGRQRPRELEIPEHIPISPRHYQQLTERIAGRPEERILNYLMLRSFKQARYSEQNVGHFALATPCYTHFTSPIRRYPDLVVHRLLRWARRDGTGWQKKPGQKEGSGPLTPEELRGIGVESSEAERRADEAERELIDLKKLDFMQQHLGDEFDGLVISLTRFGFWVELMELFVEGFVPLETLDPAADYYYREATRSISAGRHSRIADAPAFRMGDRIRVRVDRIQRLEKRIYFSVAGKATAA
ncbi:MAG: VacB/RNase II family 3'-5' exoribonuclease [Acidobacteria bacterium]|nr:VacB/RNase II family 3'-5' exoribonuclease [Acidobacteriota bacterium]